MADLIDRQEAIKALCKAGCDSGHCGVSCPDVMAIEDLPSAVVRCKDCIYCELSIDELDAWCNVWGNTIVCDGYCFYGKRKNEG